MKFAKLYTAHVKFMSHLVNLAVKNQDANSYHFANMWLSSLVNPKKPEMYEQYLNWFESGSTNDLKKLLLNWSDFDENDLNHFNAFSFIDSAKSNFTWHI